MSNRDHSHNTEPDIRQEARDWFVRLLQKSSASEKVRFETWRAADPSHDEAFRRVEAAWRASAKPGERAAAHDAAKLTIYLKAMDQTKGRRKASRRLGAAGVVFALLLAGGIWLERPNLFSDLVADHVTQRGEHRMIVLADGSSVLLDADSAFSEDYSSDERRVRLLRGTAFFDVTPSSIPFVVAAAGGEVRVLGTRFEVRMLDRGSTAILEHGRVTVTAGEQGQSVVLKPGQQVRFNRGGLDTVEDVNVEDALAWRGGRFIFYRARLADVVREVERYRPGRIVIVGSGLPDERVTGSFSLADTDAALRSLQATVGFRMTSIAGRLTVIAP